jgi:beta-glucosidase
MTMFDDLTEQVRSGEATADDAAARLLAQLTLDERLGLLDGDAGLLRTIPKMAGGNHNQVFLTAGQVERLGIPGLRFTDGPRGVVRGSSTCFPVAIARGATFDPELEQQVGEAIGKEGRVQQANLFGGLCVNALRHPGWGRAQETYGEDPVHLGRMGVALTRGVAPWLMTCVKHFALNSMDEARFKVDVTASDADLHERYLPHFKAVVDAGVDSVMTAYNRVNGSWAGESRQLITDVLRREWGFEGYTHSDWVYGFRDAVASVQAGLDVEMPFRQQRARALPKALRDGRLLPADVDAAGLRVLAGQLRYAARKVAPEPEAGVVAGPAHRALARRVAVQSLVLLRNEVVDGVPVLPLRADGVGTVAVLGRLADQANIGDNGSSLVSPPSTSTVLDGLVEALGRTRVVHVDAADRSGSVAAAAEADAAVVVVGLGHEDEGEFLVADDSEPLRVYHPAFKFAPLAKALAWLTHRSDVRIGGDRRDLHLRAEDVELLEAVAAVNPRTVVIIIGGGMVLLDPWRERVGAIVLGWYPGMEGGRAIADVLLGEEEPGGRLPFPIVSDPAQLAPTDFDAKSIRYDRWWGQRKLDRDGNVATHPYGFGLGYTTFALDGLELAPADGGVRATVEARNTGDRPGATVVQLYAIDLDQPADRQVWHLLGFQRIELPAGEAGEVTVEGDLAAISRRTAPGQWSLADGNWHVVAAQHAHDPASTPSRRLEP